MAYNYREEKRNLFKDDDGIVKLIKVYDKARTLLEQSGSCTMEKLISGLGGDWEAMACVDFLLEIGKLIEVTNPTQVCAQYRVFIK